ncbi:MAG: ATP-dependent Clp protease ATP-binding subunit ClpX, partial [Bacteroidales bacterium]|nr:ATP-dependent Clp protease ATP-binding subunit ClpX [Bacteroidales bacterium]
LDEVVIGQEEAKKTLSVAVYNHYKRLGRLDAGLSAGGTGLDKSNVLLLGETGSGKTLLVKTIAKILDIPCHIQDCTKITASGYVGSDVEDCIVGLLRASNYNIKKAERGIVMLDEFDKNAVKSAGPSITRDVSGECVQQSLLKLMEGDLVGCPPMGGRKHPEQPLLFVDTSNILFIASGAFVGLEDIIARRVGTTKNKIGFSGSASEAKTDESNKENLLSKVLPEDLRNFGIIPECIGRLPVIANVNPLSKDDLVRILTEPKDSIVSQYTELLSMDDVKLEFEKDALETVAELSMKMGTGARGLRNILESVMRDIMFDAPSMRKPRGGEKKVVVTAEMVKAKAWDRMIGNGAA